MKIDIYIEDNKSKPLKELYFFIPFFDRVACLTFPTAITIRVVVNK